MKRFSALILALIMFIGLFAGCTDSKEPSKEPSGNQTDGGNTPDSTTPVDPPAVDYSQGPVVKAVLDATDGLTLAMTNKDETGAVIAESGTVQVSTYEPEGTTRKQTFTFNWADLGLEGDSWEYLGSTFEIDITDANAPKITAKPAAKTSFAYQSLQKVPFKSDTTIELGEKIYDVTDISHCTQTDKLINAGGNYVNTWGEKVFSTKYSPNWYDNYDYDFSWYMFTVCELFDKVGVSVMAEAPATYSASYVPPAAESMANVFAFSGYILGVYNTVGTLTNMLDEGLEGKQVNMHVKTLGHTTKSNTTWNIHELFDNSVREDPEAVVFHTSKNATEAGKWLTEVSFDYALLQSGRDVYFNKEGDMRGIYACVKIAKLLIAQNPNVKIIVYAPYGHNAEWSDMVVKPVTNHKEHVEVINEQAQKVIDAIIAAGIPAENLMLLSIGDVFEAYVADGGNINDLFQEDDGVEGRKNFGNRASEKGSYLTACAMYAAISGKSPVGLSTVGVNDLEGVTYSALAGIECTISAEDASKLQAIAASAVLGANAG